MNLEIELKIKEIRKHLFQIQQESEVEGNKSVEMEAIIALEDLEMLNEMIITDFVALRNRFKKGIDLNIDNSNSMNEHEDERIDQDKLEEDNENYEKIRKHHEDDIVG